MQREIDLFKGKPQESESLYYQAKAALSQGRLRTARELFARARELALQHVREDVAVAIDNGQAQFEADFGDTGKVPTLANESLRFSPDSAHHKAFAALALARAGTSNMRRHWSPN
jgi:hypothetical protein